MGELGFTTNDEEKLQDTIYTNGQKRKARKEANIATSTQFYK